MPAAGTIRHSRCGRRRLRTSSLKNRIHVPLRIVKGICDTWSLFCPDPPPPTPHHFGHPHPHAHPPCCTPAPLAVVIFVSRPMCVHSSCFPLREALSSSFSLRGLGGADPTNSLPGGALHPAACVIRLGPG